MIVNRYKDLHGNKGFAASLLHEQKHAAMVTSIIATVGIAMARMIFLLFLILSANKCHLLDKSTNLADILTKI